MTTPLERHGALGVRAGRIVDQKERSVVLRGMSLFWSQWMPQFFTGDAVATLNTHWAVNAIRVPLAVDHDGYLKNPEREWRKLVTVIDAAVGLGLYAIVDWHAHDRHIDEAATFFDRLASRYGDHPGVIYELWSEPGPEFSWSADIKPYHEALASIVRVKAPSSLIVCGTPSFSQHVDVASTDPLAADNIVYAIHFYAATHRALLRRRCQRAIAAGLTLLATEFGACEANGDGRLDQDETLRWLHFLKQHSIGFFNWSIADKLETSAALRPGTLLNERWDPTSLTPSGQFIRNYLLSYRE